MGEHEDASADCRITQETFAELRQNVDLFIGADGASGKAFTVNHKEGNKMSEKCSRHIRRTAR